MGIVEAGVRGGAMALLLMLAIVLWRDGRGALATRFAALFCVGAAANLIATAPALAGPHLWIAPIRVFASGNPLVFLVTSLALFDDDFRPTWPYAVGWAVLVAFNLAGSFLTVPGRFLPAVGLALVFVCAAIWRAAAGRAGDLVEARRRLRLVFVFAVGLYTAASILSSIPFHAGRGGAVQTFADAVGNLVLTFGFGLALVRLAPDLFAAGRAARTAAREDPQAASLLAALERQMNENRAYREEALSIAVLAARLGVPEYRLRRLINQHLGHRNFAAFVNGYRLNEVTAALADASQAEVPIITIALDAGFQSLGPFNRAFKLRTGVTPTEYRRAHVAAA
ncbi:MAG TPA: helix-turn-helix domain-containing protein [Caulobacteraceae bacterium]|nr:helix-turn-helix domain-containing protein [Caulobacteraceae bacterium]